VGGGARSGERGLILSHLEKLGHPELLLGANVLGTGKGWYVRGTGVAPGKNRGRDRLPEHNEPLGLLPKKRVGSGEAHLPTSIRDHGP